ncbi:MAG TPA: PEP-CTERM sorting domain-containing protein [Lacipirellula sp.]
MNPEGAGADLLNWQRGLGETPPDLAMFDAVIDAAVAGAAFAVPEPRAGALIALGMAALIVRRRTAQTAA